MGRHCDTTCKKSVDDKIWSTYIYVTVDFDVLLASQQNGLDALAGDDYVSGQ